MLVLVLCVAGQCRAQLGADFRASRCRAARLTGAAYASAIEQWLMLIGSVRRCGGCAAASRRGCAATFGNRRRFPPYRRPRRADRRLAGDGDRRLRDLGRGWSGCSARTRSPRTRSRSTTPASPLWCRWVSARRRRCGSRRNAAQGGPARRGGPRSSRWRSAPAFMAVSAVMIWTLPGQIISRLCRRGDAANRALWPWPCAFSRSPPYSRSSTGCRSSPSAAPRLQDTTVPMLLAGVGYWRIGFVGGWASRFPRSGPIGMWWGFVLGLATSRRC